ncbi:hypothetical protein C0J52_15007 [Blattella germanica]|nr:hypothetical protein C0J52_15007 [Blattella germanica]
MLRIWTLVVFALLAGNQFECTTTRYEPNWESLNTRPLPQWFDDAKFGIFIHWGVYSVPAYQSEWFWNFWKANYSSFVNFMKNNYPPNFTYQDFAAEFTAEFFDPEEWAEIFQILTTKHHEGYTMWPSETSFSWNSMDVGPHRDIVGELANAIRNKTDLKFGAYHSLFEWYNPLYLQDKANNYTTRNFVTQKTAPEMYELVTKYQPEIIWSDGSIEASDSYWRGAEFVAWLYNESPVKDTAVVNDRWGKGMNGLCGDFYTYHDRYNPGVLVPHKWENCDTIDKLSFGYRRNARASEFRSSKDLITMLAETVSCGGNLLLNVAPTKDGVITPIFEERLRDMGKWLNINGEAIYYSKPWTFQNDTITPGICPLQWSSIAEGVQIEFPDRATVTSDWAWVLKMTNLTVVIKANHIYTVRLSGDMRGALNLLIFTLLATEILSTTRYEPTWESIDTRPIPQWYDDAKFGIFIHWGVFAVPSFGSEWFWDFWKDQHKQEYINFMEENYPPGFTYQDFGRDFTAEFYNPEDWAEIFQSSGANWNSMDMGPHRDLVGELANAIRNKTDLKFGLYHSLFEWYNPLFLQDKANNFTTKNFVEQKTAPEMYELVENYKPEVIWSDGEQGSEADYWTSKEFIAWLYNESPVKDTVVINDRWGTDGMIAPIFEERLRGMGTWLNINGEAIYSSRPWSFQNDTVTPGVWYTKSGASSTEQALYAIVLDWPRENTLILGAPQLSWEVSRAGIQVGFPNKAEVTSEWAWVLKMTNVTNIKLKILHGKVKIQHLTLKLCSFMQKFLNFDKLSTFFSKLHMAQATTVFGAETRYEPTWDSLDARPLPEWYDDAKFGIFIHWGVFSVPGFGSEWFWSSWNGSSVSYVLFMKNNYPPNFTYQDFGREFTAEFYDPDDWADLFQISGAKYVVLTSKHHEGYTLWPSKTSFRDLAKSIRSNTNLKFGVYHSLYEWFNPLYIEDKNNGYQTQRFVDQKTMPELYELIENYKPEVIWSDGEWEASDEYWKSKDFIAWLYNDSPVKDTVVVNDRWGQGDLGQHGDFYTYADRYNPGNLLMNVGPTKDGMISPIYEERLRGMGQWLKINGEAIYASRPWTYQNDTVTSAVYGIVLSWPQGGTIKLGAPSLNSDSTVSVLGHGESLQWTSVEGGGIEVVFPNKAEVTSEWAWVLKFTNVAN